MKHLLTAAEAAEVLNLKISTVRAWLAKRKLPRVNCGRSVRFPAEAIAQFIERNTVPAKEEHLGALAPLRVPEVHRSPGEFDELSEELPDASAGWTEKRGAQP